MAVEMLAEAMAAVTVAKLRRRPLCYFSRRVYGSAQLKLEQETTVWCTTDEEEAETKKREEAARLKKVHSKKMTALVLFSQEHPNLTERQLARKWKKIPSYEKTEWKERAKDAVEQHDGDGTDCSGGGSGGSSGGAKKNKNKKKTTKRQPKKEGGRDGNQGGRGR